MATPNAYSGRIEHPFRAKPNTRTGQGEHPGAQRRCGALLCWFGPVRQVFPQRLPREHDRCAPCTSRSQTAGSGQVHPPAHTEQHLCLDKGYDYADAEEAARRRHFVPHIRRRGEERRRCRRGERARRWVVERTHSWFNRYRKLLIRWEKQPQNYLALVQFAALGFDTQLWTAWRVGKLIEETCGVRYHPSHVWRLLKQLGWSCQRPTGRALERDEAAIRRWKRVRWPAVKNTLPPKGKRSSSSTRAD